MTTHENPFHSISLSITSCKLLHYSLSQKKLKIVQKFISLPVQYCNTTSTSHI